MKQVIVAGSINIDIVARTARPPRTGETVAGTGLQLNLGGKGANQAVAAARLIENGRTLLLGKVGNDPFGTRLMKELAECGVQTFITVDPAESTGTALITLAQEDNTIVVIPAANARFTHEEIDESLIGSEDICVAQLEIPIAAVEGFFRKARGRGAMCLLNAAPAPVESIDSLLSLVDCLVVNETEAEALTATTIGFSNAEDIRVIAAKLGFAASQTLIVTLGADGCVALHEGQILKAPARKVQAVDTTGAGDCFIGALAAAMLRKSSVKDALAFANVAASLCVTRKGAAHSMPRLAEVTQIAGS